MCHRVVRLVLLCVVFRAGNAIADEDEYRPGLMATVSDSSHSVSRVDRRLGFDWSDAAIDSRLPDAGKVVWTGNLLVRQPGRHTFHAMVSGRVTIVVDDAKVLEADGEPVFHSGEPIELSAGDHRLVVQFERAETKDSRVQLFWSSPEFTLEPLPADALSHEATETSAALAMSGHRLADAFRCAACHHGFEELPTLKAPSLLRVNELSGAEIAARLMNPHEANSDSRMPSFGFSAEQAANVAAYLLDAAAKDSVLDRKEIKFKPDDKDAGTKLLLTTGCTACHRLNQFAGDEAPNAAPYEGPDLTKVASRRSPQWLMKWLQNPEALNVDHRMPLFAFTDDERRQLVAALSAPVKENQDATQRASIKELKGDSLRDAIAEGRRLVESANCASCHRINGMASAKKRPRPEATVDLAGSFSCVSSVSKAPTGDRKNHPPRFSISYAEREQLGAWMKSITSDLHAMTNAPKGEFLLHRNGCLACHDRDQHRGLSRIAGSIESLRDDLRGQSQTLIPPALTAVGDRLKDEYLSIAVAGEHSDRRLPWLLVRMPKFALTPDDRQALVRYFIGADRIPDQADVARSELFEHLNPHHPTLASTTDLLTGNRLVGAAGFNCVACHKAGPYEPRNVAMGTRGSDIMTMGQRIRPRYFQRWMQNPIRVVPGIEMPALRKAIPGVLEDSLSRQIAMMWTALASPDFSPPTVVSRYEQFVTVSQGERPQVIRDVFTIGDTKERNSVARALAVGFDNGHNLLIDLDTMHLRQWSIGEFARQRTEGKSWFWDMAGVTVSIPKADDDFCLLQKDGSPNLKTLRPVRDERRNAELLSYSVTEDSVDLRVRFYFDSTGDATNDTESAADQAPEVSPHSAVTAWNNPARKLLSAVVQFSIRAAANSEATTGWQMNASVEDCPDDWSLILQSWRADESLGEIPWTAKVDAANVAESGTILAKEQSAIWTLQAKVVPPVIAPPTLPGTQSSAEQITSLPGFDGHRLPISTAIMPTAMTWLDDGRMAFTSLRGQVWIAKDTDGDHLPDSLSLFAEGLAAPYGIQGDGDAIVVAHKPEVLRLRDSNADGMADQFDVVAAGWGLSDDYHDWTTALARDRNGDLFVGLGSDYSQNKRPADNDRWRGTVLKIDSSGAVTPLAYSMRFPMGLAFDLDQNLFATDNQGVQNTFNEINHIIPGKHYGVPSRHENAKDVVPETASLMVPHPWTRSVNAIAFFPKNFGVPELVGHGVGCEYDTRCLIRFTVQNVGGILQGASYRFSRPDQPGGGANFVGPVASAFGPDGALYIGSIWDSGWQGGTNTGTIERMIPAAKMLNGIREIRATSKGFDVSFFHPVDSTKATDAQLWSLQGYTRSWGGSYATPDSDRHTLTPEKIDVSEDRKSVSVIAGPLKAGYVYEISIKSPLDDSSLENFWPSEGHYSMKAVPE